MEDFPLVEATLLVLTAPWWWPALKLLCRSTWEAGLLDVPRPGGASPEEEPRGGDPEPRPFRDEGAGWSQRRLINAQWDTGRRAPPKSGFPE